MEILCTICARKGSRELKNKNFLKINNKELFWHTFDQAKKIKLISNIVISTDSESLIKRLKSKNIDIFFKRPNYLSNNKVGKVPVIRHALRQAEYFYKKKFDIIIDLDVSSPLRNTKDIKNSIAIFLKNKSTNLITGCKSKKNPYFNMVEIDQNKRIYLSKKCLSKVVTRQNAPKVYDMNASIYIWKRDYLMKNDNLFCSQTSFYEMPFERSVDIDNRIDFKIVKFFLKK